MTWFGNVFGLALLLAYPGVPFWAWTRQTLFASDFVTLIGAPAIWFLMMAGGIGQVASLSNLWLEGLIVVPAAPLLLAFRLFCLDYVWRDARINSRAVAGWAVCAAIALRLMMPTLPE